MPKIKIGNTNLFFDIYGSKLSIDENIIKEKPTLIVLHGGHGFADHTLYVKFWSQFSDVAQVIFLDQRGCGRSDDCAVDQCNLKNWGQDLHDFCEALDISKPIIAGVSMGGHVMCEYISRFSDHAGAFIFCNTEAKFNLEAMAEMYEELGAKQAAEACRNNYLAPSPENAEAYIKQCVPHYGSNPYTPQQIQRCIKHEGVFENYCRNDNQTLDYLSELHKITCPTLFMVGEHSPGHPPKCAKEMVEEIRPELVTYHEFKGAGAPVYNDAPDEAYQVVYDFIEKFKHEN